MSTNVKAQNIEKKQQNEKESSFQIDSKAAQGFEFGVVQKEQTENESLTGMFSTKNIKTTVPG